MKNKYFYPIYKLKIKSWIKYWLIKQTEFKGVLSDILEGISFYLTDSLNMKFKMFDIIGRSVQDGDPTPENPVPIKNTGDNGSVNEKVQNKNFLTNLEASTNTTVTNGVVTQTSADTRSDLQWKIQTYNGTTKVEELPIIVKNTTGIFSRTFTKNSTFNRIRFGLNGSQRDTLVISDVSNLPDGEYKLVYNITNVTQGSISWKDIMITKATETDLSYVPHSEQNISFPLAQGQKLYQDEELKENGKDDMFGELVFTGIENYDWKKSTTYDGSYYFYPNNYGLDYKEYSEFKCSHAICVKSESNYKIGKCLAQSSINLWLDDGTQLPTPTAFKAYLAQQYSNGTPVTIVYKKANPTITPYTEEQQRYYDEHIKPLRTYKNVTHISSEDETPALLKIQYWKEV